MTNVNLDAAVRRLIADKRFLTRFRRDPESAVESFDLSAQEVEALKRGEADELIAFGLDPRYVYPEAADAAPAQSWALRNAQRLSLPALVAAALLGFTVTAGGGPRVVDRAAQRKAPTRARAARVAKRETAARMAQTRARTFRHAGLRRAALARAQRRA
jgi:hypothetical protein